MPAHTPPSPIFNNWRPFSSGMQPWTDEAIYWSFKTATRKIGTILFDSVSGRWVDPVFYSPISPEDVDFCLPLSAFAPLAPDREFFRNPTPVVVMLVRTNRGLVIIRRALPDGFGKLGLPGGFHNMGETWQEAACREVLEETGVILDPTKIKIYEVITVENGSINLIFGVYDDIIIDPTFAHDHEIMEVIECDSPVETAFTAHTAIIERYLASIGRDVSDCALIEQQQP